MPSTSTLLPRLVLVKPGEWRALLLAAAYFFFLLSSYYLLRPFREAVGIDRGTDDLPWLMTGTLLAMLAANPLYSALVSRLPRRRFIPFVYRFFALNMLAFYALFQLLPEASRTNLGYAFYIWLSVFNLFVVSVFWSFCADTFNTEQGKRVFGFIGVGGTLGAICGAAVTSHLVKGIALPSGFDVKVDPPTLLLIAVVPLECAVQCVRLIWAPETPTIGRQPLRGQAASTPPSSAIASPSPARNPEPGPGAFAGLALIARSPYLLLIALYILLFSLTSTLLYLQQAGIISQQFPDRAARTAAFASLDLWTNIITLTCQVFLTGRIISLLGVGRTLALLPLITIVGFICLAANPGFQVLFTFQVLRRAVHYAVDRPAREVLFTVVGPDEKYKSKSFIDTFIYRTGDMTGAWTPRLLKSAAASLGWAAIPISTIALPVAALWLGAGLLLGRMHGKRHAK